MDDRQPPNKKTRFFADSKEAFKSILHRRSPKDDNPASPSRADRPKIANESSPRRPSALDLGEAKGPGPPPSSGITPTANAFRELSFKERDDRRNAVYGAEAILAARRDYHNGRRSSDQQDATPALPDQASELPWQRGNIAQQSQQRHVSLMKASYEASQQSQFTFRPPPREENAMPLGFSNGVYPQPQHGSHIFTNSAPQYGSHISNTPELRTVRAPYPAQRLQVPKQRHTEPSNPQSTTLPTPESRPEPVKNEAATSIAAARAFGPAWGVDMDRDAHGRRVQESYSGFTKLPPSHVGHLPRNITRIEKPRPKVPENALHSPDRVKRAANYAGRKRKRGAAVLPPPAFTFIRKNDPDFNVYHGILLYPELCFHLSSHLPLEDLISLYAICKDFHEIIEARFTTVILSQAITKAPTSSHIFPFRCYGHLCRTDPAARIPHPDPEKASLGVARKVPSFKWLRMIIFREKVVHAIMAMFAERGIPLPRRCEQSIKKLWFIMDIPDNARRIGYVHNKQLLTDADLYFAVCFAVKLDMLLHDPAASVRFSLGRRLIMTQPSMSMLLDLLKGEALSSRWDILQEYVRWKYTAPQGQAVPENETLFGVPKSEWGVLQKEFWANERPATSDDEPGMPSENLLRPDQLMLREALKRGLRFSGHYVSFMTYGYVHPKTLENFEPRNMSRRIEEFKDDEYGLDDVVAGVRALRVEDGGDRFLDLGKPGRGSTAIIRKEEVSRAEQEYRSKERGFIAQMYAESQQERQALGLD